MSDSVYRLDLQYHGARFHGWQKQPGVVTVEGALMEAYEAFLKTPVFVDASGRTDAGVHARHQIAVLRAPVNLPSRAIRLGVLKHLPDGVSVFAVERVSEGWRPRPAESRQYRYFLWKGDSPPLFYAPFAASTYLELNVQAMSEAAALILGERDFSSFRAAGCTADHPIRRIDRIVVLNRGFHYEFRVTGNAFLRQMVRILVGTLVEVGVGKRRPEEIPAILESRERANAGQTMPPQGLFLWAIDLPDQANPPIPPTVWEVPMG